MFGFSTKRGLQGTLSTSKKGSCKFKDDARWKYPFLEWREKMFDAVNVYLCFNVVEIRKWKRINMKEQSEYHYLKTLTNIFLFHRKNSWILQLSRAFGLIIRFHKIINSNILFHLSCKKHQFSINIQFFLDQTIVV